MRVSLPLLLALTGCTAGGLDALVPEVRILDLEPEEGPLTGGTPVTITGFGYTEGVVAWFGDTPLPTTLVDDVTLVVTTPASSTAGPIDVKVSSEFGSDVLADGFLYLDGSATGTGTGTGAGTGGGTGSGTGGGTGTGTGGGTGTGTGGTVPPTGLTGGLAQFVLTQIACMDCFPGWHSSDVDVWAEAILHDGAAGSWLDSWPAIGTCVTNPSGAGMTVTRYDAGSWIDLVSPVRTVTLPRIPDADGPLYTDTTLALVDFEHPAMWDIDAAGGADLAAHTITNAIETPEGFATLAPLEMLLVSPYSAFSAGFSRSAGQSITWSPTGQDRVVVVMAAFSSDGVTALGTAQCVDNDDGSLLVPSSVLSAWPAGSLLAIYIYRTQTIEALIPVNGHTFEGVSQMGVLGTGVVTF